MTAETTSPAKLLPFIRHLDRFPEDLRDIRRLQRTFRLSAREASRALDSWGEAARRERAEARARASQERS